MQILLVILDMHAYNVDMKVLGIFLLSFMGGTVVALPPTSAELDSVAIVVETNTGQIAYLMQVRNPAIDSTMIADLIIFRNNLTAKGLNHWMPADANMLATGIITLIIEFESWQAFYDFNGIDLTTAPNRTVTQSPSFLFNDRTTTLASPYARFFDTSNNNTTAELLHDFKTQFGDIGQTKNLGYMFTSSFRRTHVNSDTTQHDLLRTNWKYFFYIDPDNPTAIIIKDRFANTPVWYGIAILSTILFMGGLYLVLKRREKRMTMPTDESKPSLYPYPGNSH